MKRFLPVVVLATATLAMGQSAVFAKGAGSSSQASPPAHSAAAENSNGKNAADRDFGRDRAEDRMSAQGKAHAKAAKAAKTKKQKIAQVSNSQR